MTRVGNIDVPMDELMELCRRYQVRELAVFGSALRDDFRDDSDIDLLVEFDPEARVGLIRFYQLQFELERLFHRSIDLVSKAGLHRVIRGHVLASSEVVYAA